MDFPSLDHCYGIYISIMPSTASTNEASTNEASTNEAHTIPLSGSLHPLNAKQQLLDIATWIAEEKGWTRGDVRDDDDDIAENCVMVCDLWDGAENEDDRRGNRVACVLALEFPVRRMTAAKTRELVRVGFDYERWCNRMVDRGLE
jgi:hypothetical protein